MKYKDADIDNWPKSWAGFSDDVLYGKQVLPYMKEFIAFFKQKNLSFKTVNSYIDELWAFGGTIVDAVHDDNNNRDTDPLKLIFTLIDDEGGPLLDPRMNQVTFDRTCKKFYRFLRINYMLQIQHCIAGELHSCNAPGENDGELQKTICEYFSGVCRTK